MLSVTKKPFVGGASFSGAFEPIPTELMVFIASILENANDFKSLVSFGHTCKAVYNVVFDSSTFKVVRNFKTYCHTLKKAKPVLTPLSSAFPFARRVTFEIHAPSGHLFFRISSGISFSLLVVDPSASTSTYSLIDEQTLSTKCNQTDILEVIPCEGKVALVHSRALSFWAIVDGKLVFQEVYTTNLIEAISDGCYLNKVGYIYLNGFKRQSGDDQSCFFSIKEKIFVKNLSSKELSPSSLSPFEDTPLQYMEKTVSSHKKIHFQMVSTNGDITLLPPKFCQAIQGAESFKANEKWVVAVGKTWIQCLNQKSKKTWFKIEGLKIKRKERFKNPEVHINRDVLIVYEKYADGSIDLMVIHLPTKEVLLANTPPGLQAKRDQAIEHIDIVWSKKEGTLLLLARTDKSKKESFLTLHKVALPPPTAKNSNESSWWPKWLSFKK